MTAKGKTLGDDVLAAFERACREGDLQVAEHLLQALETLARRDKAKENMEHAYLELARSLRDRPWH